MTVTIYSVLMGVLSSDIYIIFLYILRRKKLITRYYGTLVLTVLYLFCIARMLFPIEFNFVKLIRAPLLYNNLALFFKKEIAPQKIPVLNILIVVWIVVALILILRHLYIYYRIHQMISQCDDNMDRDLYSELDASNQLYNKKMKIRFKTCCFCTVPMGFGLFKKTILLPDTKYAEKDLHNIIAHECNHFYNHDLWIKLITHIFCYIFWWNPIVLLLKCDLEKTLEIKCDLATIKPMCIEERSAYMTTIVSELKRALLKNHKFPKSTNKYTTGLFNSNQKGITEERLKTISSQSYNRFGYGIIAIAIAVYLGILTFSYSYVLQPSFPPPEYVPNDGVYVGTDQVQIIKKANGLYFLHIIGTDVFCQVTEEIATQSIEYGAALVKEGES